jgi:hypothetical protein
VDAPGGSNDGNGRDRPNQSEQDGPRLTRGRGSSRAGSSGRDPQMMAVPMGNGGSELIGVETSGAAAGEYNTDAYPAWNESAPAANAPARCKFLRSIGPDGKLFEPGREAVPTHRCAAFGEPLPLSLRQQELVCLQRVHVSCPRYMRGTLLAEENAAAAGADEQPKSGPPYLTIAGLVLVAVAGLVAIFGMLGILPGTGSTPSSGSSGQIAVVTSSPTTTPALGPTATVATATASPSAVVTASATPKPTASPAATPSPTPAPVATPTPTPAWPPGATASRMNLLVPCTGQADCYLYTVRGPGPKGNGSKVADTVAGIARFFGVSATDIYALNPGSKSGIRVGQKLKIPPPTR